MNLRGLDRNRNLDRQPRRFFHPRQHGFHVVKMQTLLVMQILAQASSSKR